MSSRDRIIHACTEIISATVLGGSPGQATAVQQMLDNPAFRQLAIDAALARTGNVRMGNVDAFRRVQNAVEVLHPYDGVAI
jgi:hypothetical protein